MPRKPANVDGQRFNNLTVVRITEERNSHGRLLYECVCVCGAVVYATLANLRRGEIKECKSCRNKHRKTDITGQRFGLLKAISPAVAPINNGLMTTSWKWLCECECGNTTIVSLNDLNNGTSSCGCLQKEFIKTLYRDGTSPAKLKESANPRKTNTSGHTGVWFDNSRQKWTAEIIFQGKKKFLGRFADKADAVKARRRAEEELFESYLEKLEEYD